MRILLALTMLTTLVLAPAPAAEAACGPASGTPPPQRAATRTPGTVSFTGGGWGHGLGMSQYGTLGAARLGCTHGQILARYYPNTDLVERNDLTRVYLGLLFGSTTTVSSSTITNTGTEALPFVHEGREIGWLAPDNDLHITMATDTAVHLAFEGGGTWTQPSGSNPTITARMGPSHSIEIAGKRHGSGALVPYDRGQLRIEVAEEASGRFEHVLNLDMEDYLRGLNEVPYSWPVEALRTQAVAGRSYAQATARSRSDCTCTIYDSVRSQVYSGALQQSSSSYQRWDDAVDATRGEVLRTSSGGVAATFYSSSNGGVSQTLQEAWGSSNVDYIAAQNTARWENEAAGSNPRHRWVDDLSARSVAADQGMAILSRATVSQRTSQGRASQVRLDGYAGDGDRVATTVTRDSALRSDFGIYSNYLDVRYTHGARRRISGASRYDTAVAASKAGWSGSTTVVVARGDDPADALGGVALAGRFDAPLLLTNGNSLPDTTGAEVRRLEASTAYILGGTSAVGTDVEADLRAAGVQTINRIAGPNRFATMAAVADKTAGGSGTAFIVRAKGPGDNWADALAISGVAARRAREGRVAPILGVATSGIPEVTRSAIRDNGITEVVIVGGTAVVSSSQEAQLEDDLGLAVRRWAGANRYETSADVAGREPGSGRDLLVVTGGNFPDGLAAGALAGHVDATLLVAPNSFDTSRSPWRTTRATDFPSLLRGLSGVHERTSAVGGSAALSLRAIETTSWYLTPGAGAPGGAATATAPTALDPSRPGQSGQVGVVGEAPHG